MLRISITSSDTEPVADEDTTKTPRLQNDGTEPQRLAPNKTGVESNQSLELEVLGIYGDLGSEKHPDSTPTSALQPEGPTQRPTTENDLGVPANSIYLAEQGGNSAGSGGSTEPRRSITLGLTQTALGALGLLRLPSGAVLDPTGSPSHSLCNGIQTAEPEPTETASATRPVQDNPAEKYQGKDATNILD